jgi:hypothetical protein
MHPTSTHPQGLSSVGSQQFTNYKRNLFETDDNGPINSEENKWTTGNRVMIGDGDGDIHALFVFK